MKKYRAGKIKREHSVIEKVWPVLEQMAECELITSIIPGPISPLHTTGFEITFQRLTETGLRLLAKNGSAVQEVYVVAPEKEAALAWLQRERIVAGKPKPVARPASTPTASYKWVKIPYDAACERCGKPISAGSRAAELDARRRKFAHVRCVE